MKRERIKMALMAWMSVNVIEASDYQINCDLPVCYNVSFIEDYTQNKFYLDIDYLLLYAFEDGLSFASNIKGSTEFIPSTTAIITPTYHFDGSNLYFKTRWDSGVRAAVGFRPCSHSWDIKATYTWFATRLKNPRLEQSFNFSEIISGNLLISDYQANIIPRLIDTPSAIITFSNQSNWKLQFNQVDLEIGKEFYISEDMTLRPDIGFRGLIVGQNLYENNTGPYFFSNLPSPSPSFFQFNGRNSFGGFGIKGGMSSTYTLGYGLDIYGNLQGALIWGRHRIRQSLSRRTIISGIEYDIGSENLHLNHNDTLLNLDVGIGVRLNCWLNYGKELLSFKLGWEQHLFTKMNQFQNMIADPIYQQSNISTTVSYVLDQNIQRGDLSLAGFVFGASYLF